MKKIILFMMFSMLMLAGNVKAQQTKEDSIRIEQDILQAKLDSLLYDEAVKAIDDKAFTLEADQVVFKYGEFAYVNANTNFVSVKGDKAVVQVAFNIPVSSPNGLGGVTVEGSVSGYKKTIDKKGTIHLEFNVMGNGISAQVFVTMPKGTSNASVEISPNFNSNRLTLNGVVLPIRKSHIFQGRTF